MIEAKGGKQKSAVQAFVSELEREKDNTSRFGVIDIGSNSIRLLVVELHKSNTSPTWQVIREERAMTRLARGVGTTGLLSNEAMNESAEAIRQFVSSAAEFGAASSRLRAFATSAVRDAANRDAFLSLVRDQAEIEVEVISGTEEAKFAFQSAARIFEVSKGDCAVVDIGGGSAEVIQSRNGVIFSSATMPLGAVRLTELFGGSEEAAGSRWNELEQHCKDEIKANVRAAPSTTESTPTMIGCGGTFSTLAMLAAASQSVTSRKPPRRDVVHKSDTPITLDRIEALLDRLRRLPLTERQRVPGLPSDRADIIVAGLTVAVRLMKRLGAQAIHIHAGGVREGMMLKVIAEADAMSVSNRQNSKAPTKSLSNSRKTQPAQIVSQPSPNQSTMHGVHALGAKCNEDPAHSNHVTYLALSLYDSLSTNKQLAQKSKSQPKWGSHTSERLILEAAGILHDTGIMIEYCKHHKHSESIVRHADLQGWNNRDREMLVQVCRYHRRSEPSERHEAFAALSVNERDIVVRLSAVLRVADSLDRSHRQVVRSVQLRRDGETLWIDATTSDHAHDERRAVAKKGKLLEKLLGVSIHLTCEPVEADIVIAPGAKLSAHADHSHIKVKKRTD